MNIAIWGLLFSHFLGEESSMNNLPLNEGCSVEQGLVICKAFLSKLWLTIEGKPLSFGSDYESFEMHKAFCEGLYKQQGKAGESTGSSAEKNETVLPIIKIPQGGQVLGLNNKAYEMHRAFCRGLCKQPGQTGQWTGSSAEWNEGLLRVTKIPKEEQRRFQVPLNVLFLSVIEFCKIYHERYDAKLSYLLQLLESMKQDPQKFQSQWQLMDKVFDEIKSRNVTPYFDWDAEFSQQLKLPIVRAFAVCLSFFADLWPLIESKLPPSISCQNETFDTHQVFCSDVSSEAMSGPSSGAHAKWNEAIYRFKGIPKEKQKKTKLSYEEVFFCAIEFCKIYNRKFELGAIKFRQTDPQCKHYEGNLHFLLQLLGSMRRDPQNHPAEWSLFKRLMLEIEYWLQQDFDWDATFDR